MSEEIIKVEAKIRITLFYDILRPVLSVEFRLESFRVPIIFRHTSVKIQSSDIQILTVIEHMVSGDIRHHIG